MLKRTMASGLTLCLMLACAGAFAAEWPWKRAPKKPDVSLGAIAGQVIGGQTLLTIEYHRPGVKGREVWGGISDNPATGRIVPHNGTPRPWRAGANEATTFETSHDVLIEGQALPAGKYALFMIPTDGDWTLIFNAKPVQWGSFRHIAEDDVLRVEVSPVEAPHQEWLVYGFEDLADTAATAYLRWEKKKVTFRVELAPEE